jgi:hypothetical protein
LGSVSIKENIFHSSKIENDSIYTIVMKKEHFTRLKVLILLVEIFKKNGIPL